MSAPLLDFTTLEPERPKIRIRTPGKPAGVLYELAVLSDFGLVAQSRMARLMREAQSIADAVNDAPLPEPTGNPEVDAALRALDNIPEAEAERVDALLDEMVALILRAPDDVRAGLHEAQKRQLIEAFMPAVEAATPTVKTSRRPSPMPRSTSARSSRASARPTATGPG